MAYTQTPVRQYIDFDMGDNSHILNLPAPAGDKSPVRLIDLNQYLEGLAWKDDVRVATTGPINIAAPGANIDAIFMAIGDRVVVKDQASALENGLYIFNGAAVPMTRAVDGSTGIELNTAVVPVLEGTVNAGTNWRQTAINPVLGTDPVNFTAFGAAAAPVNAATEIVAGIAEIATQAETDAGVLDTHIVTPLKIMNSSLVARKAVGNFTANGATRQFNIAHNLNMSLIADIRIFGLSEQTYVQPVIVYTDNYNAQVSFNIEPPAGNTYAWIAIA